MGRNKKPVHLHKKKFGVSIDADLYNMLNKFKVNKSSLINTLLKNYYNGIKDLHQM